MFVGFVVAVFVAPPLAALGVVVGVAMAIMNLRFLDGQTAKVEMRGEQSTKAVRRQLGGQDHRPSGDHDGRSSWSSSF